MADYKGTIKFITDDKTMALVEEYTAASYLTGQPVRITLAKGNFSTATVGSDIDYYRVTATNTSGGYFITSSGTLESGGLGYIDDSSILVV